MNDQQNEPDLQNKLKEVNEINDKLEQKFMQLAQQSLQKDKQIEQLNQRVKTLQQQ